MPRSGPHLLGPSSIADDDACRQLATACCTAAKARLRLWRRCTRAARCASSVTSDRKISSLLTMQPCARAVPLPSHAAFTCGGASAAEKRASARARARRRRRRARRCMNTCATPASSLSSTNAYYHTCSDAQRARRAWRRRCAQSRPRACRPGLAARAVAAASVALAVGGECRRVQSRT